jgi:hypothetical protein
MILSRHACILPPALVPSPVGRGADAMLVTRDTRLVVLLRLTEQSYTDFCTHFRQKQARAGVIFETALQFLRCNTASTLTYKTCLPLDSPDVTKFGEQSTNMQALSKQPNSDHANSNMYHILSSCQLCFLAPQTTHAKPTYTTVDHVPFPTGSILGYGNTFVLI